MLKTSEIQIVVQVNGKLRGKIKISTELEKQQILEKAKQEENVAKFLADKEIIKEIVVSGKLINFVVK